MSAHPPSMLGDVHLRFKVTASLEERRSAEFASLDRAKARFLEEVAAAERERVRRPRAPARVVLYIGGEILMEYRAYGSG